MSHARPLAARFLARLMTRGALMTRPTLKARRNSYSPPGPRVLRSKDPTRLPAGNKLMTAKWIQQTLKNPTNRSVPIKIQTGISLFCHPRPREHTTFWSDCTRGTKRNPLLMTRNAMIKRTTYTIEVLCSHKGGKKISKNRICKGQFPLCTICFNTDAYSDPFRPWLRDRPAALAPGGTTRQTRQTHANTTPLSESKARVTPWANRPRHSKW